MLTRQGTVVRSCGNRVVVRLDPVRACGACADPDGCGIGPLVSVFRRHAEVWTLPVPDSWVGRPGERVHVALAAASLVNGTLIAYGLPLLGAVGGAWLALRFAPAPVQDAWSAAGALAGLLAGFLAGRRAARSVQMPQVLVQADRPVA